MKRSITQAKGMEGALASSAAKGEAALGRIGKAAKFAAVGGIAALGVVLDESVKKALGFQSALEMVKTQAGASQSEVDNLRGKVLALAKTLPQGPEELAKGLFHLESIGLRGGKAMDTLKIAAQGAAVGNASLEETATALGSAWLVNIKGAGNLRNVMGLLNATVGAGNMRMGELVQALGTGILPAAKEAGLSIKDVFGALAVFTDEGYQASSAAAQFSTALHFLYNPTAKATAAFSAIGLKSTSLAADMHKPNGLLVALTDLKTHLDKTFPASGGHALSVDQQTAALNRFKQGLESSGVSGKKLADAVDKYKGKLKDMGSAEIAQEQLLGEILPGGRGRILLTLLNQLDRYKMKLHQVGAGVASFGDDVRKTQETDAYKIKTAWSKIEVQLISLGSHVAPFVASSFSKIADVVSHIGSSGTLGHIFGSIGRDASQLGPALHLVEGVIKEIGAAAGFSVHEIEGLVNALGGIGVVVPALLGAYGAIKGFQIAMALLVPIGERAVLMFGLLRDAIAGGELLALPGLLAAAVSPATALTIAVGAVGAAIAILATRESYEAQIAKSVAQAKRDQANATRDLASAEDGGARSVLDAQQAHLSYAQARKTLAETAKKYGTSSTQYRQALVDERTAGLNWVQTHKEMEKQLKKLDEHQRNVTIPNTDDYTKAMTRVDDAQRRVEESRKTGAGHADPVLVKRLAEATKGLAEVTDQLQRAQDRGAISAIDAQRKQAGLAPIAQKNISAISLLTSILNRVPQKKRTKLEADDQDVLAKLGRVVPELITYGKMQQAAKILANSSSAEQALARVRALINELPASKTIDVFINQKGQVGGGAFGQHTPAPKKHASGEKTKGPEFALIGEDGPEYVIPVSPAYRGRGIDLLMMAARDLGIPGFKKGKAPPKKKHTGGKHDHKHRAIPPKRDPISLPLDTFQQDENKAKSAFDTADRKVQQDERQMTSIEKRTQTTTKGKAAEQARANARKELDGVRKTLAKDKAARVRAKKDLDLRKQELKAAQSFAAQIKKQEDLVEIARNAMELADKQDDQTGYDAAKGQRSVALDKLKDLYNRALTHIKAGTPYARTIQIALGKSLNEIQDVSTMVNAPEPPPDAQPELTDAQQKQLDDIEAAIALDEIRTPYDLGIEKTDVQKLVDFREAVLAGLQASSAPNSLIGQAAQDVKSARDELANLTAPGAASADAQAQIDQANARAAAAEDRAQATDRNILALASSGDIGQGGFKNALQAAGAGGVNLIFQSVVPPTPQQVKEAAKVVIGGAGGQSYVPTSTTKTA